MVTTGRTEIPGLGARAETVARVTASDQAGATVEASTNLSAIEHPVAALADCASPRRDIHHVSTLEATRTSPGWTASSRGIVESRRTPGECWRSAPDGEAENYQ